MKRPTTVLALALVFLASACYHATIETGLQPNGTKIVNKWAMGFAWGLVPPEIVETAEKCPNGVARVETQLSFMNQLVNFLTFAIVTPMQIEIECAAGRISEAGGEVLKLGADQTLQQILSEAAEASARSGEAVYVTF